MNAMNRVHRSRRLAIPNVMLNLFQHPFCRLRFGLFREMDAETSSA
nr:hypothetical protein [Novosphingobium panipatense]